MSKDIPLCSSCGQEMELAVKFPPTKKRAYRIRRFECSLCDIQESIVGSVSNDSHYTWATAQKAIKDNNKKLDENECS